MAAVADTLLGYLDGAARKGEGLAKGVGAVPKCELRGPILETVEEVVDHLGYHLRPEKLAVKTYTPRRKFGFHRLEPGGRIALIQFEPALLATQAGLGNVTMILDALLVNQLASTFVFTEGATVDSVYRDEVLPGLQGQGAFERLQIITRTQLDELGQETLEDRAAQFKVWMGLRKVTPPDPDQKDTGFDQPPDVRKTVADALIAIGEEASSAIVKASLGKLPHELIRNVEGYRNRLPKLVDWASRQGHLENLVLHALRYKPDQADLIDVARRYQLESTKMRRKDIDKLIEAKGLHLEPAVFREEQGRMETRICQVQIAKKAKGTGFLVGKDLVLTNYHVIEAVLQDKQLELRFRFDHKMKPSGDELYDGRYVYPKEGEDSSGRPLWKVHVSRYHPEEKRGFAANVVPTDDRLDYALIRLAEPVGSEPVAKDLAGSAPRGWIELPESIQAKPDDMLAILHYPAGDHLRMTLGSNAVIGFNDDEKRTRLFYLTGTLPGSSGAPCFSGEWQLLAMHNSGDTIFKGFNSEGHQQGVPADKIRALLKNNKVPEFLEVS